MRTGLARGARGEKRRVPSHTGDEQRGNARLSNPQRPLYSYANRSKSIMRVNIAMNACAQAECANTIFCIRVCTTVAAFTSDMRGFLRFARRFQAIEFSLQSPSKERISAHCRQQAFYSRSGRLGSNTLQSRKTHRAPDSLLTCLICFSD